MEQERCLTSLNIGESAKIKEILTDTTMKRRLYDLGMIKGTIVECVLKSPASDPIAYKIRGAVIALRNEYTNNIKIY